MKRYLIFSIALINMILLSSCNDKSIVLTKLWDTDSIMLSPESIVYDNVRNVLYVSNVNITPGANSDDTIFAEYITKLDLDGNIINLKWIENINRPAGIIINNGKLIVTERKALAIINIEKGIVERRIPIIDAGFPNDVTADENGVFYVTDSNKKCVYKIKNDSVEVFVEGEEVASPNGILYDNGKLIIGINSDNYLKSIDIATKEIKNIAFLGKGIIDGIRKFGDNYLVSHYEGNIYMVSKEGVVKELLNTRKEKFSCADFEFIESKHMIFSPVLNRNMVTAYRF
jgi:sugar lactone lactonase YvrE